MGRRTVLHRLSGMCVRRDACRGIIPVPRRGSTFRTQLVRPRWVVEVGAADVYGGCMETLSAAVWIGGRVSRGDPPMCPVWSGWATHLVGMGQPTVGRKARRVLLVHRPATPHAGSSSCGGPPRPAGPPSAPRTRRLQSREPDAGSVLTFPHPAGAGASILKFEARFW